MNIFDAEFGELEGYGKRRREAIRREHEAFWNTGQWAPANYIPADPPVTVAERAEFIAFHGPRTQIYSCVLPGEIVRQCLDQILAGNVDPAVLIHLEHLIVDEFQDLNPIDQQFVDELIARNVVTFIAGDDDQSIYSFRYGAPAGIQDFVQKYQGTGQHTLVDCFRCASTIVQTADDLIAANPGPNRIPKTLSSMYTAAVPPTLGNTLRWRFNTALGEAEAIADSCLNLINQGLSPRDVLILLSNQRELLPVLSGAMNARAVAFESPQAQTFVDSPTGRLVLALIRITCDPNDYVAHRTVLGARAGVGITTLNRVAESVLHHGLNYRDVFHNALPIGAFVGRSAMALNHARHLCAGVVNWQAVDTLALRTNEISALLAYALTAADVQAWQSYANLLPQDMTLEELRDWLWADGDDQQMSVLARIYARLGRAIPAVALLPPKVRIMSMHGAKGLSARVVFIPGLEDDIFPGPWRQPYPGLVLEAARLLYVSITRARAACILSYATRRTMQGQAQPMAASRFTTNLHGNFGHRQGGLQPAEVQSILTDIGNL